MASSGVFGTVREWLALVCSFFMALASGAAGIHLRSQCVHIHTRHLRQRLPLMRHELAVAVARRKALELELLRLDPDLRHELTASIVKRKAVENRFRQVARRTLVQDADTVQLWWAFTIALVIFESCHLVRFLNWSYPFLFMAVVMMLVISVLDIMCFFFSIHSSATSIVSSRIVFASNQRCCNLTVAKLLATSLRSLMLSSASVREDVTCRTKVLQRAEQCLWKNTPSFATSFPAQGSLPLDYRHMKRWLCGITRVPCVLGLAEKESKIPKWHTSAKNHLRMMLSVKKQPQNTVSCRLQRRVTLVTKVHIGCWWWSRIKFSS